MREILFRGQTRRKGEKVWMDGSPVESNWVYGGVLCGSTVVQEWTVMQNDRNNK